MSAIQNFLVPFLTAMILENAVFSRALGLNKWARKQDSPKEILWYGGLFCWISLLSTAGNFFVSRLLTDLNFAPYLRAIFFVLVVCLVYLITYLLSERFLGKFFEKIALILPLTAFNTALFSIFHIMLNRNYTLARSLGYALGTSFGYTIALLLMMFAKRRFELSPIPRSFKGLPITLLYMGLISLALYGLLGYGVSS